MDKNRYIDFSQNVLKITFKDIELLITAFTHRSYLNEHKKTVKEHNERLEFLGDAVLELVVTEYLYANFSEPEGVLTNWRSSLVRTESLAESANLLQIESLLRLSKGEEHGTKRARVQILANTFEAIIGAIYLDQGYESASKFIKDQIISKFNQIRESGIYLDYKSKLQEVAQKTESLTPSYRVLSEEGPDHEKNFKIGVFVGETIRGEGEGPSKQSAQQKAAQNALNYYKNRESD